MQDNPPTSAIGLLISLALRKKTWQEASARSARSTTRLARHGWRELPRSRPTARIHVAEPTQAGRDGTEACCSSCRSRSRSFAGLLAGGPRPPETNRSHQPGVYPSSACRAFPGEDGPRRFHERRRQRPTCMRIFPVLVFASARRESIWIWILLPAKTYPRMHARAEIFNLKTFSSRTIQEGDRVACVDPGSGRTDRRNLERSNRDRSESLEWQR